MFLRADSTDAAHAPAFADVGLACRMPWPSRPEAIELTLQQVAHMIIGVPGVRAGEDVAFGGDGDVTLPAAAAVDVRLRVLEEPHLGPLAADAVSTYSLTAGRLATNARMPAAAATRSRADGKPGQFARAQSPLGRRRVMPSRTQLEGFIQAAPEVAARSRG